MRTLSRSQDLERALDLVFQPLLVETLTVIGEGTALEDGLPANTDMMLLDAALDRLVMIGAIEPPTGRLLGRHTLTSRGDRLLGLLDDLYAILLDGDSRRQSIDIVAAVDHWVIATCANCLAT